MEDHQTYPFGSSARAEVELRQQKKLRELETYGAGMRTSDGGSMQMPVYSSSHTAGFARDSEVRAALYGVEQTGDVTMPGLDSLEDELAAKRSDEREARIAEQQGEKSAP